MDLQFLLDAQAEVKRHRTDGVDHEGTNRVIDASARDLLAEGMPMLDPLALTRVDRDQCATGLVIPDGHPQSAFPTDHQTLQEGRPFTRGTAPAIVAVHGGVLAEHGLMLLELLPRDVARMRIADFRRR